MKLNRKRCCAFVLLTLASQLALCELAQTPAGLALNPASPIALLEEVLPDLDLVLIMSVNPGFGGQRYISGATDKIRRVRRQLDAAGSGAALEVDGGITVETIRRAWEAGADTFVAGTAVFGQPDPAAAVQRLKQACATPV